MKGGGGDCVTWDDFVHRAFVRPLKRFLEACDTVVLAFDNYAQVCPWSSDCEPCPRSS